jgi:hypothetical protein
MKKLFLILLVSSIFLSCKEKKIEFIQSKAIKSLFLIKNPPHNDSLLKKEIYLFLYKNHSKSKDEYKMFYKYSSNTKPFIDNERPGGYFREYLDYYPEDEFATFTLDQCKEDTTKLLGKLYFYGLRGSNEGQNEVDTIIYKCK